MDKVMTAWVAGILEGEGCFHMERRRYPRITVQMTDEDVIRKLQMVTGVGKVNGPYNPHGRFTERTHWKPAWRWIVSRPEDVNPILNAIRPLMGERRGAKIDECLAFVRIPGIIGRQKQDFCQRNHPLSGDNLYVSPKGKRRCQACALLKTGYRLSRPEAS